MADGPAFDRAYLDAVRVKGSDATGTFGLRIMWSSVADLIARLVPLFPDCATDAARFERAFAPPSMCICRAARRWRRRCRG